MKIRTRYRTHHCGELRATDAGRPATISGFYVKSGEDGFDLRDRHGRTRVALSPGVPAHVRMKVVDLGPEDVVMVTGDVLVRVEPDPTNPTGDVYVFPKVVLVLSKAETLPPDLGPEKDEAPLEERLRLRWLDLRRPAMQKRLAQRAKLLSDARAACAEMDFLEVETPLLSKWTAEDAMAFVVPGRGGAAFALPTNPQAWKQLLVAGGVDRYFQIARCFRNETELADDKQLEFTALDLECAFVDEDDVFAIVEQVMAGIWTRFLGKKLRLPLRRLTYAEAMLSYGTDRPDLRFDLDIIDVTEAARRWPHALLKECLAAPDGTVRSLRVPGGREQLDDAFLAALPRTTRLAGPGVIVSFKVDASGRMVGAGAKGFETDAQVQKDALAVTGARPGDAIVLVGAKFRDTAAAIAGEARLALGRQMNLIDRGRHELLWITSFPYHVWHVWGQEYVPARHFFTMPADGDEGLLGRPQERYKVRSKGFDLVLDGVELGAGSIRNHELETQRKIFKLFQLKEEEVARRFGFLLEAFRYGLPPHGGISVGLDRLLMRLTGAERIEDVVAFPKGRDGRDALIDAPNPIDPNLVKRLVGA
jgi:aspartyl-tRNA synthetase